MLETLSDPPEVELFDGTPHAKVSPRLKHADASGVTRFQDGDTVEHCATPWLRFAVAEVFADQDSLA